MIKWLMIKNHSRNCSLRILGSPMVKTPHFYYRYAGSIPGQGTKIILCGVIKKNRLLAWENVSTIAWLHEMNIQKYMMKWLRWAGRCIHADM